MASEVSEKEEQNHQQDISQEPQQEMASKEENTQILVKNIPETATEDLLRKSLDKFGKILQVKIVQDMDRKPTGEALIEFETKQEKDLALNSNEELEIGGKKIEIKDPTNEGLTLFVGNIPYSSKESEVEEFFSECGKVEVKFFYFNGSFKGYAYVTFLDESQVEAALKKDGQKIGDREIKIERLKSRNFIQPPRGRVRRGGYRGRGRGGPSFGNFDRERKVDYFRERRERERDRYRDWDRGRQYNRFRDRGDRERDRDRDWNRDRDNRDRRERSRDRERDRDRERERSREYNRMRERGERDRNERERERHREYEREREERDRGERDRDREERDRNDRDREKERERESERHREYERDRERERDRDRERERRNSNYEQDKW